MSTFVRVQVLFEMEHDCGPWDDTCLAGALKETALREAQETATRVVAAAAQHAHVRLRVLSVGDTIALISTKESR